MIPSIQPPSERRSRGEVRAKILDAAVGIVSGSGLQAVTQARVAEAAGLRQSHVTYYFPARLDLIKAIVQKQVNSVLDNADSAGKISLRRFRDITIQHLKTGAMPRMVQALLLASDEDPTLRAWLRTYDHHFQSQLRQLCRTNGLNPSLADIHDFHSSIIGAAMLAMHDGTAKGMQCAIKTVRKAFDRLVHDRTPSAH